MNLPRHRGKEPLELYIVELHMQRASDADDTVVVVETAAVEPH